MAVTNVTRAAAGVFRQVRKTPRHMRLPAFRSVTPGQPTSIIMPLGVTYHRIFIRFLIAGVEASEAQARAQVANIKATIDGDAKIDASADELLTVFNHWNAQRNGANFKNGTLTIHLARPWEQEIVAQDGPAWGCAVEGPGAIRTFNFGLILAVGATIDSYEAWAEVTEATPLGRHFCLRRVSGQFLAAGDLILSDWPSLSPEISWYATHFNKSGGAGNLISDIGLKIDTNDEVEFGSYAIIQSLFSAYGLQQQAGWVHLPFARRGRPMEALPVVFQDARLTLRATAALGSYSLLIETQEGVDNQPHAP